MKGKTENKKADGKLNDKRDASKLEINNYHPRYLGQPPEILKKPFLWLTNLRNPASPVLLFFNFCCMTGGRLNQEGLTFREIKQVSNQAAEQKLHNLMYTKQAWPGFI
ncbi:MAG: hypothetical protein ACPLZD_06275 [Candidatus Saccharicenans sp.]|nr:MAG: hypothetical protein C0168_09290 [Candidatus Aminicenantes bacterium]HEK84751.1 hypothetical protein [Candidatus Aminicenantes bacterium]